MMKRNHLVAAVVTSAAVSAATTALLVERHPPAEAQAGTAAPVAMSVTAAAVERPSAQRNRALPSPHRQVDDTHATAIGGDFAAQDVQLRQLRDELARLGSRVSALQADAGDDGQPARSEASRAERAAEREALEREQRLARIDELEAEAVDTAWSVATSDAIESGFAVHGDALGVYLDGIDCRSSFCRIDVSVEPDASIGKALTLLPFESEAFFHSDDDDPHSGSLFVTPGAAVPGSA